MLLELSAISWYDTKGTGNKTSTPLVSCQKSVHQGTLSKQ